MEFLKIAKDPATGSYRLGRLITVIGAVALTFGFYKEALVNGIEWRDYWSYAIGMTIMYAPAKAVELINAVRGTSTTDMMNPPK